MDTQRGNADHNCLTTQFSRIATTPITNGSGLSFKPSLGCVMPAAGVPLAPTAGATLRGVGAAVAAPSTISNAIPEQENGQRMSFMLEAALVYVERGFAVFPLHTPLFEGKAVVCSCEKGAACPTNNIGKHPRISNGCHGASNDPATIRMWWAKWPDANIGIVTGAASGLVVVDVDPRNGGDDGFGELVQRLGPLPETPHVLTGGGGHHYLFKAPAQKLEYKAARGVEILQDGRYFVAAPSMHRFGKRYAWEESALIDEVPIAALPDDWLSNLAASARTTKAIGSNGGNKTSSIDNADPEVPIVPNDRIVPAVPNVPVDPVVPVTPEGIHALLDRAHG